MMIFVAMQATTYNCIIVCVLFPSISVSACDLLCPFITTALCQQITNTYPVTAPSNHHPFVSH